jgi:hypothetical protein
VIAVQPQAEKEKLKKDKGKAFNEAAQKVRISD